MKSLAMSFKAPKAPVTPGFSFSVKLHKMELREIEISYSSAKPVWSDIITGSSDAEALFRSCWHNMDMVESAYVIHLKTNNQVLGIQKIGMGGTRATVVDPKVIFGTALKALGAAIILAHNHPSGGLKPSKHDQTLTSRIHKAGEILDIKLLDHLILTPESGYYSFKDDGYF